MQSPFYKQNKINKVDISLKQLLDVDTTNELAYRRVDNIFPNQVLTSYTNPLRRDAFRFKYLTDLIQAGTGVTITNNAGIITIASTGTASPLTTKGDLYTYTTTNARLPVGTNGQILYADSTTATGLKWDAAPTGGGGSGIPFATASGTDTYTATVTGVTSYTDGDVYIIRFTNGNTDGSTLNINGLGAKTLYKNNDGPLIGGDIWDGAEMLCVYNLVLDAFDCIGTSPNTLYAYVTNVNGSTITKGQAVYAFGGTGNRMTVKLARANADATSAQTIGFVYSTSIADNQKGVIIIQGYFINLSLFPTSTWSDGDPVYLSPTTAGAVTKTKPHAPSHLVYLGVVATASNGSAGRMYVRVQNGYELDELHNVQAQSPSLNDTLWYDSSVSPGQWKTASIPTILGYTPVATTRSISTTSPLTGGGDLSADRTLSIPAATGSVDGYLTSTDWTTFNGKANLASPAFTGNPTAPTPSFGDNDTSIATTAFVQAALNTPSLIKVNANLTSAVNSTSLTTLYSFYIPANTVATGDMIHVIGRARKTPVAANGNCSLRIYVNTSATAGGAIVGVITTGVANNVYMQLRREISVTNATNSSIVHLNTSNTGNDDTSSNGASSVLTIDWTVDQYIILGITPVSSADTWYGMGFRAEIKKYNP